MSLFLFIDRHKDSPKAIVHLVRFVYSITSDWEIAVLNILAGLVIPIVFTNKKNLFVPLLILTVLLNVYFEIVRKYRLREYANRKLLDEILHSCMVATDSLTTYMLDDPKGQAYFINASQFVCIQLYECLKSYYHCEFRISVVQNFQRERNGNTYCKMIARKSANSLSVSTKTPESGKKYFYEKIINDKDVYCVCLPNPSEIKAKGFIYSSRKKSNIKQYIGILEDVGSLEHAFLLQVDCMERNKLGKNKEEMENTANRFLLPFVSLLKNAYQHERVVKNELSII